MAVGLALVVGAPASAQPVEVYPPTIRLSGPESRDQLRLGRTTAGRWVDLTGAVPMRVLDSRVAAVDRQGRVAAVGDGDTTLIVGAGSAARRIPIQVRGASHPEPVSFAREVLPLLTRYGCNGGRCHGKAEGRNGFKLSVFGFDPPSDQWAISRHAAGRRVVKTRPEASLILKKAISALPHAGGKRFDVGSAPYRLLARWIGEGASYDGEPVAAEVTVEPREVELPLNGTLQLRVLVKNSAGVTQPVTAEAEFASNAPSVVDVDPDGRVQAASRVGEGAILVKYQGRVAVCRVLVPRPGGIRTAVAPSAHPVDRAVWSSLSRLGIQPSEPASDSVFLRRVYLDAIGTLPTAEEARQFLSESRIAGPRARDAVRSKWIDRVLDRPEYADYWAMRWADILRVDRDAVTAQGAVAFTRWLKKQFSENRPYDVWVREILTAQGSTRAEGPAAFYRSIKGPDTLARSLSQLFLGTRLECAQCHQHPSERWGQDDYWAFAGFFSGVTMKNLPDGADAVRSRGGRDLANPRTGVVLAARGLGAKPPALSEDSDRRAAAADWMLSPENRLFARAIANRLWAHYFGRGLVEPIDDLRVTNPASNAALLSLLESRLRELKFDLKAFTRLLLTSRVYQLSGEPNATNRLDDQQFSRAYERPMPAEVLLDAVSQVAGVPEKFNGWPPGYRAIQVWDNRMPSYFLKVFGRPVRASVCECERSTDPTIAQALHLMNSPEIGEKLSAPGGRVRELAASQQTPDAVIDEAFLASLTRYPTPEERQALRRLFGPGRSRQEAIEDLFWTVLNTKSFLYLQ